MRSGNEQVKRGWEASGAFVPAGLLIGMGVGWMFGHLAAGLFIGLGAGLLIMAVGHIVLGR